MIVNVSSRTCKRENRLPIEANPDTYNPPYTYRTCTRREKGRSNSIPSPRRLALISIPRRPLCPTCLIQRLSLSLSLLRRKLGSKFPLVRRRCAFRSFLYFVRFGSPTGLGAQKGSILTCAAIAAFALASSAPAPPGPDVLAPSVRPGEDFQFVFDGSEARGAGSFWLEGVVPTTRPGWAKLSDSREQRLPMFVDSVGECSGGVCCALVCLGGDGERGDGR